METRHVMIPERDEDRRELFCAILHLSKRAGNRLTVEELEGLCLRRGYLKVSQEDCKHNFRGGDVCPFCGYDQRKASPIPPTPKGAGILGVF